MYPVFGHFIRTLFCECKPFDSSFQFVGLTGVGKSLLVALLMTLFGRDFTYQNLPSSREGTGNALEVIQHVLKDLPSVFDDFAPIGERGVDYKEEAKLDRFVRAQGGAGGKIRLERNSTMKETRTPRGSSVITGEDIGGHGSGIARAMICRLSKGDIIMSAMEAAKKDGAMGRWGGVASWLIQHYAPQLD